MRVTKLWIHPVKSCRAIAVDTAELDDLGFVGDRRFLVTDLQGKQLTQRSHPAMATIATALDANTLTLSATGFGSVHVPRQELGAPLTMVEIWNDRDLQAEDCGPTASAWLSDVLRAPARLTRIGPAFRRAVAQSNSDGVNFADAYPVLVISEASLSLLNDHLAAKGAEPVPMNRFRPNIVIEGAEPHAEDGWNRIRIGDTVLRGATLCSRCIMTTTDQTSGERGPEPLRTLATYRRDATNPRDVNFGRNMINESKHGRISLGLPVELV
jgi:uncharacterized protein